MRQHRRDYNHSARGNLDVMFKWVPYYEPGQYDVAILHLDQQCIEDSILRLGKGSVYADLNEVIQDIPKIVIMHGTPFYPEVFPNSQEIVDKVKKLLGDNYLVVNSHRAVEQWGMGKVIIHGLDPKEWFDLPKEPRVVTMISPAGLPAYYDRTFLDYVKEGLAERDIFLCHITVDMTPRSWDEYRNFLGRSLLYFNPTRESPMPRARTEAMLSGCCVITTPHQDADMFIQDGVNGFLVSREPKSVVDLIEKLLDRPDIAQKVGQAGRETALKLFSWDRYAGEWQEYLKFVINDFNQNHAAS